MKTIAAISLSAILLAGACSKQATTTASNESSASTSVAQTSLSAEQLGELGAEIKKHPDNAKQLLSDKGLTEESFAQAVRKVAEDPAASQRYAAAYKKAS